MLENLIIKIAGFITYLQTGIRGDKTMDLFETMAYINAFEQNKTNVAALAILGLVIIAICIAVKIIKELKRIKTETNN